MPDDRRYFTLRDHVGPESEHLHVVDAQGVVRDPKPNPKAGDPGPLRSVGIQIPFPIMVGNDVVEDHRTAEIAPHDQIDEDWKARPVREGTKALACARIIPGTRIVETNAPPVVDFLVSTGWVECDPPQTDTKARQAAGKASDEKAGE